MYFLTYLVVLVVVVLGVLQYVQVPRYSVLGVLMATSVTDHTLGARKGGEGLNRRANDDVLCALLRRLGCFESVFVACPCHSEFRAKTNPPPPSKKNPQAHVRGTTTQSHTRIRGREGTLPSLRHPLGRRRPAKPAQDYSTVHTTVLSANRIRCP